MRVGNVSRLAFVFQYFRQFQEKRWPSLLRWNAPTLFNYYNHCQCAWPAHMAESWPRAWLPVLQSTGGRMLMLTIKPLLARDRHRRNLRERKFVESAAIKARGSVHRRAQGHSKWPSSCWEFHHLARIGPTSPDSLRLAWQLSHKSVSI